MNTLYALKHFLTYGFSTQWYLILLLIVITAMTVRGIICIIRIGFISHKFKLAYLVMVILFISFYVLFVFQKPQLISPKLPLFDKISVSPQSPLRLVFDRPLDKDTTFEIYPPAAGSWHFSHSFPGILFGNTITFTPTGALNPGSEYTVSIENLTSLFGNDYSKSNSLLFVFQTAGESPTAKKSDNHESTLLPKPTITVKQFRLGVPLIKQNYRFGCFSSAANMALAHYGIKNLGEVEFINKIGRDTTKRNFTTNTWGNPNQSVVGTIDGSNPGGYGVHWDPVARILNTYRPTEVKRKWSIDQLLFEVENGHPVLVWWVNGVWPAKDVSWNLPTGEKIYAVNGMHVEVVTGWKGPINNPELIYTNDPWRGYRAYSKGQFESLWKWFDNTAVVVR